MCSILSSASARKHWLLFIRKEFSCAAHAWVRAGSSARPIGTSWQTCRAFKCKVLRRWLDSTQTETQTQTQTQMMHIIIFRKACTSLIEFGNLSLPLLAYHAFLQNANSAVFAKPFLCHFVHISTVFYLCCLKYAQLVLAFAQRKCLDSSWKMSPITHFR